MSELIEADHWSEVPDRLWTWPNFAPAELASRGDGSLLIEVDALERLQWARIRRGAPFVINSAYRDPVHNAIIGGAPMSQHKFGRAFDISLRGHTRRQLLELCRAAGFSGFGYYRTFLHVDTGRPRFWWGGPRARGEWHGVVG